MLADYLASIKINGRQHNKRPTVTLSYAQSLDGSIALSRGTPYALSGSESQILTHRLRAAHDAVLVGINTVIADNPYLSVRLVEGGARVITSFLSRRLVDRVVITIAPIFLGGLRALELPLISGNEGSHNSSVLPELKNSGYEPAGKDIVFYSELTWENR